MIRDWPLERLARRDEADRMLDMGFFDDIATYPEGIAKLAAAFMREPNEVNETALNRNPPCGFPKCVA